MKKNLHSATYRPVVFQDDSAGFAFLTQSTAQTNQTIKWQDGQEYPLVKMFISSASHPFYTGKETLLDEAGRVDKFEARRKAAEARRADLANKAKEEAAQAAKKAEAATAKAVAKVKQSPATKAVAKPTAKTQEAKDKQ